MNAPVKSPEDMQVVLLDIEALLPYARNSKDHSPAQVEIIAGSIKRFGWTNPCLVADGVIIAGHGRVMAAKKLGLKRVPCIDVGHLSEDDRRAYVIMDNRSAETGASWNLEMLKLETDYLRESGFDLEAATGFAEEDLAKLFEGMEEPEHPEGMDPDDAPEAPAIPVSEPGDIWVLGDHRLMCGSSLEPKDWDKLMGSEQADAVWTDPPYNVDIGGKNKALDKMDNGKRGQTGGIMNDKMGDKEFYSFLLGMYQCVFEVMKPGAPIYVAHADGEGINFRTAFRDAGFKMQACIIWNKNVMVLGRMDFQYKHEPILYGWKPGAAHKWYGGRKNTTVMDFGDGSPFVKMEDGRYQIKFGDSSIIIPADTVIEERLGTVIYEPKPAKSGLHPTQKPVALVERLLRNSARPGNVVVDAFGGSGTTLIAAERLGMRARLMELDPKFCDVIVIRWQQLTGRKAVHAVTGEPFPAEGAIRATVEAVTAPVAPVTGNPADVF